MANILFSLNSRRVCGMLLMWYAKDESVSFPAPTLAMFCIRTVNTTNSNTAHGFGKWSINLLCPSLEWAQCDGCHTRLRPSTVAPNRKGIIHSVYYFEMVRICICNGDEWQSARSSTAQKKKTKRKNKQIEYDGPSNQTNRTSSVCFCFPTKPVIS